LLNPAPVETVVNIPLFRVSTIRLVMQDFATIHRMFILNNWDDFTSKNGVKYPTFDCGFEPPISDGKTSTYPLIFGNLTYLWKMDEHGK
jgi:hypothetical protein